MILVPEQTSKIEVKKKESVAGSQFAGLIQAKCFLV